MHYLLIVVGTVVGLFGLVALALRIHLFTHSVLVDGRVVDLLEESLPGAKPLSTVKVEYRLVVAFKTADGAEHRVKSTSTFLLKPTLGECCPVRYAPNYPEYACIATFRNFWLIPASVVVVGVAICTLGLFGTNTGSH
jgi:hypothetical protein